MKVIVTGSRDLVERVLLELALKKCWHWAGAAGEGLTVVHGDARGADAMARAWADRTNQIDSRVHQIPYPANWAQLGVAAGAMRNTYMVDSNYDADLCIAFPRATGTGTRDCAAKCEARGIPVWMVHWSLAELPKPPRARLVPEWEYS